MTVSTNFPEIIYITGIDGSGKSTVTEHLAEQLRQKGHDVDILWLRFNHVFTKPLLALCRLIGLTKYEVVDGIRVGYHDFYKSALVSRLFTSLQYIDALRVKYTRILPALRNNKILILDRYVYDILIDIAVDTRDENLINSNTGKKFIDLMPANSLTILVDRSLEDVLSVRPEGKVDRNFTARYSQFQKLKETGFVKTVDNHGSLDDFLDAVNKITGISK